MPETAPVPALATWLSRALCAAVPAIAPWEPAIRTALIELWPRLRGRIEDAWAVRLGVRVSADRVEVVNEMGGATRQP